MYKKVGKKITKILHRKFSREKNKLFINVIFFQVSFLILFY